MNIEQLAREALARSLCLRVQFEGMLCTVEVHALGTTERGELAIRVWQTSQTDDTFEAIGSGWKLLSFSQIESCELINKRSLAPRLGYRRTDPDLPTVVACY